MDSALFQALLDFIQQHPLLTGLSIFLVAFAESLAIVGLFMPGAVLMFAFGMLIGSGQIGFAGAFTWSVAGAIAGDGLSFWLGRHYHQQLKVVWPFKRYPQLIAKGTDFFAKHGSKSILFGRFVGPVRPIIPAIAGMMEMPSLQFFLVNLASALLWAPAYLLPGMAFGASLSMAAEVAGRLVVILLLLLLLIMLTVWLVRWLVRFLQPRSNPLIYHILHRSQRLPYLGKVSEALLDPQHPEARVLMALYLMLLFTAGAAALLWQYSLSTSTAGPLNMAAYNLLQTLRTDWADGLMLWLTRYGSLYLLLPFSLLLGLAMLWRRDYATTLYLFLLMLLAQLSVLLLKNIAMVERPQAFYEGLHYYAFPSSHSLMATVFFGFMAVIISARLPLAWRWLPYSFAAMVVMAVGFSRLYLGMHWLTDVLGGILLGLLWVSLAGIAYRRHHVSALGARGLLGLSTLLFLGSGFLYSLIAPPALLPRTEPVEAKQIGIREWRQQGWLELPRLREDLRGFNNQPFNLQWAARRQVLEQRLQGLGWQAATPLGFTNALRYLAPSSTLAELPVPNHIHHRHTQALMYSRLMGTDTLSVIRLWPASKVLADGRPLWFGNISHMRIEGELPWIRLLATQGDFKQALAELPLQGAGHHCRPRQEGGQPLLLCMED